MSRYSRKSSNHSGPITNFSSSFSSLRGGATSSFAATSSSSHFTTISSSSSPSFFHQSRSSSPTRVHLVGTSPPRKSPAVRYDASPARDRVSTPPRRTCMCSPTTHPGSFRCSLHKNSRSNPHHQQAGNPVSNRLNARRSAMTNSLVRIGTVEGDLVKRALAALIRPSSHHQRRRDDFRPRPSRLSVMSKADPDYN